MRSSSESEVSRARAPEPFGDGDEDGRVDGVVEEEESASGEAVGVGYARHRIINRCSMSPSDVSLRGSISST